MLNFRFRYIGKAKDYRYEYVENGLAKIPIKFGTDQEVQEIISLSQRMLDLHYVRQVVTDVWFESLNATMFEMRNMYFNN